MPPICRSICVFDHISWQMKLTLSRLFQKLLGFLNLIIFLSWLSFAMCDATSVFSNFAAFRIVQAASWNALFSCSFIPSLYYSSLQCLPFWPICSISACLALFEVSLQTPVLVPLPYLEIFLERLIEKLLQQRFFPTLRLPLLQLQNLCIVRAIGFYCHVTNNCFCAQRVCGSEVYSIVLWRHDWGAADTLTLILDLT